MLNKLKYTLCFDLKLLLVNSGLNPRVDCGIIIKRLLFVAVTCCGGKPHAETLALSKLGRERADIMFVSLEPCSRFGKTPPCVYSVLANGVSVILILRLDRAQSSGFELLRSFAGLGLISANFNVTADAAKCVSTLFGQLGASSKVVINSSALNCLRLKANVLCISLSTLRLDNSALVPRASVLKWGSMRAAAGDLCLDLRCCYLTSYSCCLSLFANTKLPICNQLKLNSLSAVGFSLCVCELGCLLTRTAQIANTNVAQFLVSFPLSEGLFACSGCLVLNKRLFWCGLTSLSV